MMIEPNIERCKNSLMLPSKRAKENKVKWNTSKKKDVEWWNGRTAFYFSDPALERGPKKFKTELAFLMKD